MKNGSLRSKALNKNKMKMTSLLVRAKILISATCLEMDTKPVPGVFLPSTQCMLGYTINE